MKNINKMLQQPKYILVLILLIFLYGCSNGNDEKNTLSENKNIPEIDYIDAKQLLDNENYEEALVAFKSIEKKYPLSNWSLKSKIMIVFINYLKMEYSTAELDIDRFINKYPDYKDIDYAYYLKALINYEQIRNPSLDATFTNKSLENFEELIRRFPESKYAEDGRQKVILIKTILAGKDMHIAFYYLQNEKYLAALNRYIKVIDNYEPNRYTPEALHRIVEIYYILGMIEDSKKIAAILGYNYPESTWYERAFNIVGDTNYKSNDDQNWADKLLNKVFN